MLFDSHAHYDDKKFNHDRDNLLQEVHRNGVSYILNAASDVASLERCVGLANKYPFVYAAVGIHPHDASALDENIIAKIEEYTKNKKVVAIGEIGLDYHYDFSPRDLQKHWFERQIELAKKLKLPVIIHDREAHDDILRIVKDTNACEVGGVFHCFSGSVEMVKEVLKLGFYVSFGGPVTFKNAKKLPDVLKNVPLDKILVETDCPYLTPEPFRGQRNDSSFLKYTVERISEILDLDYKELENITTDNAKRLFGV